MNPELPTTYEAFLQVALAGDMDQRVVMDGVLALDEVSKKRLATWAAGVLAEEEPLELERIRATQFAAALLPASLETALLGLRSPNSEVRFSVVCSLTDAPRRALESLESELVSAVWEAATTSSEGDVEVIAADFLALLGRKATVAEMERRDLTLSSDFFLWLLTKDVFGRRLPRSLARESFARKLHWRRA